MDLRHLGIEAAFRLLSATGANRWAGPRAQGLGVILTLHHVRPWQPRAFAPNRLLEITPEFLDHVLTRIRREGHDLVSLDEMADRLARPRPGRLAVALTFDDGYRDNVIHALPVLRRHGAPWTLFVTTGFADGTQSMWWLDLEEALARLDDVAVNVAGARIEAVLDSPRTRQAAFTALYRALRKGPEADLRAVCTSLAERAGIDGPARTRALCLDWDALRALSGEPGVTIGAHTLTHPMLAKHDLAIAQREITESRLRLAYELGRPVQHMAYPVGDPGSAGPREFDLAMQAGYRTAVTTRPGHVFAAHADHLLALPRISLNGLHQSDAALSGMLSGVPFALRARGRRLDVA